jgi:hypothetical protein
MAEMVVSTLMLVVTAVFFCTLGLFFSSFSQRTLIATVLSYSSILISFIVFIICLFFIGVFGSYGNPSTLVENIVTFAMWFLFSTNPFYAAAVSEVILIDQQSLFFTTNNFLGSSSSFPLLSPWIIYVIFYAILTVILICFSIYFVSRPNR